VHKNTQFSPLLKGWTPIVHTNTRLYPTSSKLGVSSFREKTSLQHFKTYAAT